MTSPMRRCTGNRPAWRRGCWNATSCPATRSPSCCPPAARTSSPSPACSSPVPCPSPVYPPARPSQLADHRRRHTGILANARAALLATVPEAVPLANLPTIRAGSTRSRSPRCCRVAALPHGRIRRRRPSRGAGDPPRHPRDTGDVPARAPLSATGSDRHRHRSAGRGYGHGLSCGSPVAACRAGGCPAPLGGNRRRMTPVGPN